jgi:tRNA threonylcarbamoyladenosine biosynthesis protein TsaB
VYYFGDGAEKCQALLETNAIHYLNNIVPNARFMGALALQRLTKEEYTPVDVAYYEPFYLKEYVAAPSHVKGLK